MCIRDSGVCAYGGGVCGPGAGGYGCGCTCGGGVPRVPLTGGKLVSDGAACTERGPSPITSGVDACSGVLPCSPAATRSTSSRIASAVGNRCAGSLRSACATSASTAGVTAAFSVDGAGGVSCTCLYAIENAESPSNGSCPLSSSNSMQPTEYRSDRASTLLPSACSGDRYCGVPTTMPVCVIEVTPDCRARAMPKSITLTTPLVDTITLAGLMSRCTSPWSCEASSADSTAAVIFSACSVGIAPRVVTCSSSTSFSERPSTNSMTMYGVAVPSGPTSSPESNTETMLVCWSRATACASRRNRSLNEASRPSSVCSVFTAT